MIKLKVEKINQYEYELKDENEKKYNLNLEFCDINESLEVEDIVYINEKLLDKKYEGYSTSYTFGNLESKYGKEIKNLNDIDVIKIVKKDDEVYLKRIYG